MYGYNSTSAIVLTRSVGTAAASLAPYVRGNSGLNLGKLAAYDNEQDTEASFWKRTKQWKIRIQGTIKNLNSCYKLKTPGINHKRKAVPINI